MTTTILRKAATGETGNSGEFGTHARDESAVALRPEPMAAALTTLGQHIADNYPGATDIEFEWNDDNGILIPYAVYADDEETWSWVGSHTTDADRRTSDLAATAAALFSSRTDTADTGLVRCDYGYRYLITAQ